MGDKLLLDVDEVILETGLSRASVYRLARLGGLGEPGGLVPVRCGRAIRFSRRALDEWIDAGGATIVTGTGRR